MVPGQISYNIATLWWTYHRVFIYTSRLKVDIARYNWCESHVYGCTIASDWAFKFYTIMIHVGPKSYILFRAEMWLIQTRVLQGFTAYHALSFWDPAYIAETPQTPASSYYPLLEEIRGDFHQTLQWCQPILHRPMLRLHIQAPTFFTGTLWSPSPSNILRGKWHAC